jgi:aspartyl-tRNA(Asn)/glutamyl-tRNA(Gln) amidotransferase subunit B
MTVRRLNPSALSLPLECLRRYFSTFRSLPPEMQPVIGLEIHAQLNTKRKLFSCSFIIHVNANIPAAPAEVKAAPNTLVGYHDIGLPGSLPVLNKEAVLLAVKAALALGCTINHQSSFDRKHYFYKDLPSGYQITQQYSTSLSLMPLIVDPLAVNGSIVIAKCDDTTRQLREHFVLPITRIQLEQDTAKTIITPPVNSRSICIEQILFSPPFGRILLDHNRASIPLVEIITPPSLTSPHQAATAFAKVAEILRATGTTTADLHLGAMRCDVNVSLGLGSARTEIKNLFSVRAVRDSCSYEIAQQIRLFESGEQMEQCTKTWDGIKTITLRVKEGEKDYRYFPNSNGLRVDIYLMRIFLRLC